MNQLQEISKKLKFDAGNDKPVAMDVDATSPPAVLPPRRTRRLSRDIHKANRNEYIADSVEHLPYPFSFYTQSLLHLRNLASSGLDGNKETTPTRKKTLHSRLE